MLGALVFTAVLAAASPDTLVAGEEVIRAMHDRYAGRWWETLTIVQTTMYYDSESGAFDRAELWYESVQLPGRVRSDIAPIDDGNSEVFRDDSVFRFRGDSLVLARPAPHPVLLLGFDVYVAPVEGTIERAKRIGFDLSKVREAEWQGREVYVVGSSSPDDRSSQFWIEKERLLVVRLLLVNPDSGRTWEVHFKDYRPLGDGWIAAELIFLRDGRRTIREQYNLFEIGMEFEPSLFAATGRTRPTWVRN